METLSVVCPEPEGTVTRTVTPIIFTSEEISKFYEKASQFPVLFGRPLEGLDDFMSRFFWTDSNGLPHLYGPIWKIDDFIGVFYLSDLYRYEATAHFAFFDRRFRGRDGLVKEMIRSVFKSSELVRLNVEVPLNAGPSVFKFVSGLGFALEGRKRACAFYKNRWFDSNLYGILRREVLIDGS